MKLRRILSFLLAIALLLSLASVAFAAIWTENPTGYTKASDVKYVKVGNYITNWGVRGETATFLTSYAQNYYTGSYTYAALSGKQGNANTGSTPSSALYKALKDMMNAKSTSTTSYNGTRDLYSNLKIIGNNQVQCTITNTGNRKCDEVVQLYLHHRYSSVVQPERQLIAFKRITLEPGESRQVTFHLDSDAFSIVDANMQWTVEPDTVDILIGSSSQDIRLEGTINIPD